MFLAGSVLMGVGLRRFNVWLISLTVVLAVYLVYSRLSRPGRHEVDASGQHSAAVDANSREPNGLGVVGAVGIGGAQGARYEVLNKDRQVERAFGFKELVHGRGDQWEVDGPYIDVYRGATECHITADRGQVVVETVGSTTTARDATFTGNVIIRIVRTDSNDANTVTIYLDDVVFEGAKSQFSTGGFVEVVSERFRMAGTGLELIFDEQTQTLEYMKIGKLDSLRLRPQRKVALFTTASGRKQDDAAASSVHQTGQRGQRQYRCVFNRNVRIETAEYAAAADVVSVTDIFEPARGAEQAGRVTNNASADASGKPQPETQAGAAGTADIGEIAVTCEGPVVIAPMDATIASEDTLGTGEANLKDADDAAASSMGDAGEKTSLTARRIDYSLTSGEAVAEGACEIRFRMKDVNASEETPAGSVRIEAAKRVRFSPDTGHAAFEGNCRCVMSRPQAGANNEYILIAPQISLEFSPQHTQEANALPALRYVGAGTGGVHLGVTKRIGAKLVGGMELKCVQFEYDADSQSWTATGPGVVKVDNSGIESGGQRSEALSLQRPCYALLQNFARMTFQAGENLITAEGDRKAILVDYFPLDPNGKAGEEKVSAAAGRVEAKLYRTAAGQNELASLVASNGVSFEDPKVQFEGSDFAYDPVTSLIKARGSAGMPCLLNGAIVDGIEYNVRTRRVVKASVVRPGAVR